MLEIFSMHFGFLICSCKESKVMENGHYFVPMRPQVWLIVGVRNLKSCILDMNSR